MKRRECEWCRELLPPGIPAWKTMHVACYAAWRRREDAMTDGAVEARVARAYAAGFTEGRRSAAATELDKGMLRLLLQLTHPDKHEGSAASVKAAAYLNGLRERLG